MLDIDIFETGDESTETRLVTSIQQLDSKLGNLPDGILVLKGKAGTGKTALGLQLAKDCKQSAIFVTAEMSQQALAYRLIARTANTSLTRIVNRQITKDDLAAAWDYTKQNTAFIHIEDSIHGFISPEYLRDAVIKVKASDGSTKVLLIIDSISDWINKAKKTYTDLDNKELAKKFAVELNDIAKEEGFTVLAILQSEQSREIDDIFEFAAEVVLELRYERDGRANKDGLKQSNLRVLKNRFGTTGTIILNFNGDFQTFTE